jgi:Flp pilus assembly protein TadG
MLLSLARFWTNCKGGVAPMLALGIIPLMGAIGAAVDYGRANSVKAAMQNAIDATALQLAKNAGSLSSAQLQSSASSMFLANFNRPEAQNVQVGATYSSGTGGFNVAITGSATVNTNFMGLFGYSQVPITTSATVNWNNAKLRVALALDNTGSMSSNNKLTALKSASHNLLTQLQGAATSDGDVYVSIVPFAKDVNGNPSNYQASWIDWTDWDQNNGSCNHGSYSTQSTCTSNGTCSSSSYTTQSTCTSHNRTWTWNTWTHANHSTWNGCVTDRDQNYDTMNTAPSAGSTLFPAEQYSSCPAAAMGLSYNWTTLSNKVDAMTAGGNTNQAIGLAWGWQTLSGSPFTVPAKDPNYTYQDIIILLTDGLNTQDRWYTSQTSIDNRQALMCTNIKAAGVIVYSVQVNINGVDPTSTLLQNCASDSTKFFLLTSSSQIVTTFQQIGTAIAKLHLAK